LGEACGACTTRASARDREEREISMLSLHLLRSALVHIDTLLLERVLSEPAWADRLTGADSS
jgi:TnpA family transposase